MQIVLTILRLTAFALSTAGYVAFVRAYWRISPRASYVFVLSALACLMYFAGLLNVLLIGSYALFFGGVALFIVVLARRKMALAYNRSSLSAMNIGFALGLAFLVASLIDTKFVHYDNFSHWAVVVKSMLIENQIPTAASAIIDFKSYPLGSSSFLYYFCRVVGSSEGVMLIGQGLLLTACFYAVFGVIRDQKRFLLSALLGLGCAVLAFFNISIRVNNLLVDFLLPALALAALGSLSAEQASFRSRCLSVVPVLGLLVITKNTGIFFAALVYVFLLYRAVKLRNELEKPRPYVWLALAAIAASLLPLVLWNFHTALAFPGDTSKFSYDLGALTALKIDKTPEQIRAITSLFLKTAVSLNLRATQGILLFNALALAAYVIARFALKKRWKLLKVLLALDIALVLYYAGILGMYIVSMPLEEALRLAGFDRYASSMVLLFIGALSMCAVSDVEQSFYIQQGERRDVRAFKSLTSKNIYQAATVVLTLAAAMVLVSEFNGMNSIKAAYDTTLPAKVEAMVGDNWTREDDSIRYLFYATDTNEQVTNYYLPYVGRYFLFASQVDAVSAFDEAAFMGQIQTYDKFVILESTPEISAYMQAHAGLPGEPGIYIVKDTFPEAVIP
ncbi:hypothetical protein SDC9_85924 [bioreactor metagenome]|uniref:Glycosyltransferase RgtA/B/C/D-like domain-containing protein n=1 Tax=bioreactor metagenome TaxID=1076179 RepID=A0A644ZHK2_9ZZZZ